MATEIKPISDEENLRERADQKLEHRCRLAAQIMPVLKFMAGFSLGVRDGNDCDSRSRFCRLLDFILADLASDFYLWLWALVVPMTPIISPPHSTNVKTPTPR
jgi:hypothetical protein